jgi:hypothetical protein
VEHCRYAADDIAVAVDEGGVEVVERCTWFGIVVVVVVVVVAGTIQSCLKPSWKAATPNSSSC